MSAFDGQDQTDLMRSVLERFGSRMAKLFPGIEPHVEFHPSRVYAVAGSLSFVSTEAPENELVVISVQMRTGQKPKWEIDATDRDSVVFAELVEPAAREAARMASDPMVAAEALSRFLEDTRHQVVRHLSGNE